MAVSIAVYLNLFSPRKNDILPTMKNLLLFLLAVPFFCCASDLDDLRRELVQLKSLPVYVWAKKDNQNTNLDRRAKRVIVNRQFAEPRPIPKFGSKSYAAWLSRRQKLFAEWCAACGEVQKSLDRLARIDYIISEIGRLTTSK